MRVVAAIPAYNEEVASGSVIARTKTHMDEMVVIDDGSHDATSAIADSMEITLLRHEVNSGKGLALHMAFAWPIKHDVNILVAPILEKDADVVNGARFLEGHNDVPAYRRLRQEVLTFAANLNNVVKVNDSHSGFRAFHSSSFDAFRFTNSGMGIESEMIAEAAETGLCIKEVPITCRYDVGDSTFNPVKHGLGVLNSIVRYIVQTKAHPKDLDNILSLN